MENTVIIKNRQELDTTPQRKLALDVIEAGIRRVLPDNTMTTALAYDGKTDTISVNEDRFTLSDGRIFVIGGGKASGLMAETLEKIIPPERITAGIVTCKTGSGSFNTTRIKVTEAGHPVPDTNGIDSVRRMLGLKHLYDIDKRDIIICLISGGGSALMPSPVDGVSLEDKQAVTGLLLSCGADIHEINTVRKHLSGIKGGRLCEYFSPATVVSLILSDVIGNDLNVIASGPTSPDSSTFFQAREVLDKYRLVPSCPVSVTGYIDRGCRGEVPETPKDLETCRNYIIGDNRLALEAMAGEAEKNGLKPFIITAEQKGETGTAARLRASEIIEGTYAGYNAIILGGETTPVLPENPGKGGRNQHYAAVSIQAMQGYPGDWTITSVGTDGSDFLPDVAGAIVDNRTLQKALDKNLDVDSFIERHDSYNFFNKTGESLVVTGSTGTNVGDVVVYVLG